MAVILNQGMLTCYEQHLREQGVPVDKWARPGLGEREMVEALAPLGLSLPLEGRLWWGWHDGGDVHLLGPWREFLSLAEAVERYRMARSVAEESVVPDLPPLDDPDYRWNPSWLPITGSGHETVIDCSVPEGAPTPLRCIDWQNVDGFFETRTDSLGYMVAKRIEALEVGAWRWNRERSEWEENEDLLDREFWTNPVL